VVELNQLAVQIAQYVDDSQPGWVASEFEDAYGHRHTLIDKVPIFTSVILDANSAYPQVGMVRCEALARWKDAIGRELVRITTVRPDGLESTEGLTEFVVFSSQLSAK
jgi:hypothetical protein